MKEVIFTIVENIPLTSAVFKMVLEGNTSQIAAPGQFVEIAVPGRFLRRPISVCDWSENSLTLIYKVVGSGTADLSTMTPGTTLNILTGLGNGYDLSMSGDAPLLLGGGVGVPPMYGLCKALLAEGKTPTVILGFNTAAEVFYEDAFRALGVEVLVTTVDGSRGIKGFVTDAMTVPYTYFYTCGPGPMLRAIDRVAKTSGQFSMEERMGCGFGACMGCSCKVITGYKRICKDGPVLEKEEILWDA